MLYLLLYVLAVIWVTAALLYTDDYLVHSKTEVLFAPLVLVFAVFQAVFGWGYRFYRRRTQPYAFGR